MSDFDLRGTVRAILDETDLAAPEEIAEKVIGAIPKDAIPSVLRMLLREWVHVELSRARMKAPESTAPSSAKPNRSAKVQAIRDAAPGWLRDRVWIGGGAYALVGDCTYENLQFLQADREQSAARHLASADAFARLAGLVRKHKVPRVGDLPKRVLDGFEWRAAE